MRILKHKKAGEEFMLVKLVLALLIAGALLIFIFNTTKACQPLASDETCRSSLKVMHYVAEKSFSKGTPAGWLMPDRSGEAVGQVAKSFPVACKYESIKIKQKRKKDVIPKIRELVDRCWYKMGSGEFSPFGTNTVIPDVHCFTCFTFKADKLESTIYEGQLRKNLQTTLRPTGQTYWEYIHAPIIDSDVLDSSALEGLPITTDIEPGEWYSVILIDIESSMWSSMVQGVLEIFSDDVQAKLKRLGVTKLYIQKTNDAKECYNDGWFTGTTRPIGERGGER